MKEHEREELERMEKLIAEAERNPLTKKFRDAEAVENLIERRTAAEAIEVLKKERGEVIPRMQADLKAKEEKYLMAKAMLDKVMDEVRTVKAALSSEGNSFDTDIRLQEQVLYETADPLIDETITFFRGKLDYLRSPGRITKTGRKSEKNLVNWTKKTLSESNVQAVHDAIEYCRNTITELGKMKLLPELDTLKLQELKDGIPSIDEYQEVTGQAPMEGLAPTTIEPCEYTLKRLFEKVNKHLKTPTPKARV